MSTGEDSQTSLPSVQSITSDVAASRTTQMETRTSPELAIFASWGIEKPSKTTWNGRLLAQRSLRLRQELVVHDVDLAIRSTDKVLPRWRS